MITDIVLHLNILRPGSFYGKGDGVPQTEEEWLAWIDWRDPNTTAPTWAEILALGDIELAEDKLEAIANITADYETACDAGFTSSALGATHTYGSTDRQVVDLLGAIAFNASLPFGCKDASLTRVRPTHTTAQLKQALTDGITVKVGYHATLTTKLDAIEAAGDYATLNAITWSF